MRKPDINIALVQLGGPQKITFVEVSHAQALWSTAGFCNKVLLEQLSPLVAKMYTTVLWAVFMSQSDH